MTKYFKNVKSYDDLKSQYKTLLKANHPDNGGDLEAMKEINVEYDALFPIWKNRKEVETGAPVQETADSTRQQFYTQNGWEGSRHDWNRSLKEVAQIVRTYVKEKYPTYKFSVRTEYASMCQELHVTLKESPIEIYKTANELNEDDKDEFWRKAMRNNLWKLDSWYDNEFRAEYERIAAENGNFYKVLNEATKAVIDDVDSFVKSYNYSDCDGMIDYFDVDFYYFGCAQNNGMDIKIVPKTARIKNKDAKPAKANNSHPHRKNPQKRHRMRHRLKKSPATLTRSPKARTPATVPRCGLCESLKHWTKPHTSQKTNGSKPLTVIIASSGKPLFSATILQKHFKPHNRQDSEPGRTSPAAFRQKPEF